MSEGVTGAALAAALKWTSRKPSVAKGALARRGIMGLVALLPGLAAARPPPDSKTFESLCVIHAPNTGPHDISKDEYGKDEYLCGSWSSYMGAAAIGSRAYLTPPPHTDVGDS